jgi:septum formation protein
MEPLEYLPDLILASASPRRSELLGLLGIPFRIIVSNVPEDDIPEKSDNLLSAFDFMDVAREASVRLAGRKAAAILAEFPESVVIGADTLVVTEEEILGKPGSFDQAVKMLGMLSGRTHKVFTGVSIRSRGGSREFCSEASVTFYPLDEIQETLIQKYAATGSPLDKAGAYGIQDAGALLISSVAGDYYAVVGLPISRLARELSSLGFVPNLRSSDGNPSGFAKDLGADFPEEGTSLCQD